MPTPFMHLEYAERLRPVLSGSANGQASASSRVTCKIESEWPAFYLGSIAPDYQAICDVPREKSHFYPLPLPADWDAVAAMLEQTRELADVAELSDANAVFVAAYLAHLLLDEIWYLEILLPYFVQPEHLGEMSHRMLLHNMMLIYLDRKALHALPGNAGTVLATARATAWLPFAMDHQLGAWQTMIVDQLQPGAFVQTVPIFAGRMGLQANEMEAWLDDDEWLERELFANAPLVAVEMSMANSLPRAAACVRSYLRGERRSLMSNIHT